MMGPLATAWRSAFRDFVTDGIPETGPNHPNKADIRALGDMIEDAAFANIQTHGGADMNGDDDATGAIIDTAEYLNDRGGGILQMPPGTPLVSSALPNFSNVYWFGAGPQATIIKAAGSFSNTSNVIGNQTDFRTHFGFSNFSIDMNEAALTWPTDDIAGNAITLFGQYGFIKNVELYNVVNNAIVLYLAQDIEIDRLDAHDIGKGDTPGEGISSGSFWSANAVLISACQRVVIRRSSVIKTKQYGIWAQPKGGVCWEIGVEDSRIVEAWTDGIFFGDPDATHEIARSWIKRNRISGNGRDIGGSSGGCGVRSGGYNGQTAKEIAVDENIVWENGQYGAVGPAEILIDTGSYGCSALGNKVMRDAGYGIRESGNYSLIANNAGHANGTDFSLIGTNLTQANNKSVP